MSTHWGDGTECCGAPHDTPTGAAYSPSPGESHVDTAQVAGERAVECRPTAEERVEMRRTWEAVPDPDWNKDALRLLDEVDRLEAELIGTKTELDAAEEGLAALMADLATAREIGKGKETAWRSAEKALEAEREWGEALRGLVQQHLVATTDPLSDEPICEINLLSGRMNKPCGVCGQCTKRMLRSALAGKET